MGIFQGTGNEYLAGIDVGSTTTKIVVLDADGGEPVFADYSRHHADQKKSVVRALKLFADVCPEARINLVMTGSGAKPVADAVGARFVQEVAANAIALREMHDDVGTAIELGGQDAKMIFFAENPVTGRPDVADMRMNGSCAGGTGAFIDEAASILEIPVYEFDRAASEGRRVYDISGRCGVYAKTDIQPLLNQGVSRRDLALSVFHAIAKQTIGGLAQGLEIRKPVAFEGGPLTFNKTLVRVFMERLGLSEDNVLIPRHPEMMIAMGAALSGASLFAGSMEFTAVEEWIRRVGEADIVPPEEDRRLSERLFPDEETRLEFVGRHRKQILVPYQPKEGEKVPAYLGIDSGSTTTKFVLMHPDGRLLDAFYAGNEGDPLMVAVRSLRGIRDRYRGKGAELEILGCGTTGYGEMMFHKAFCSEYHTVETVAHARAALEYGGDVSFILDIGGQDMKAIWVDHGVVTNIVVNEACSSGCGSFLENFARSLQIPVTKIAAAAFSSRHPAVLGSRCTVFMNSSIITEQRNGKLPEDIMAGLCRSIIENVFTKVIRISNVDSLGDRIIVQGGTFENDAVLRAMEQYLGKKVVRAPYPGLMGAIGAALLTREHVKETRTFIGLDALDDFSCSQESDVPCPFCGNHCRRTVLRFANGSSMVTGNRCERGEILGDPGDNGVKERLAAARRSREAVPDLFALREKLLFRMYDAPQVCPDRGQVIGIPRVLSFWDTMPFWTTFWRSLGYGVRISPMSTRKMYESGLPAVTSDTVCFPAKLVHGHLRALAGLKADRIFMPCITTVPSENREKTSESMCAVVKGYPMVIRNSDNPETRFGIPFDTPLFHWYTDRDRNRQLTRYMRESFGIPERDTEAAIRAGDRAMGMFREELLKAGEDAIRGAEERDGFCVVLASRPYQNDPLVNHDLPAMFTSLGIPVLTADSVPGAGDVDLSGSRLDIVNNYHARMLSTAVLAAQNPHLQYVQIVNFGCGHDAYLSDEIQRMMREISGKTPLILKVDESDIAGPLRIRVRSFVETVRMKKRAESVRVLPDPYPVKFGSEDRTAKTVLVPNTSHAFCRIMSAAMRGQHIRTVALPVGRKEAIRLGKQYVHNDICFPAQVVIGEVLEALRSGAYDVRNCAVAMGKYIGDCRLTHYSALLRKALDDAGYPYVPILTNDDVDRHDMHPGYRMNLASSIRLVSALPMIDALEGLLRRLRPYELVKGSAEEAFRRGMDLLVNGLESRGIAGARSGFSAAVELMKKVRYDRESRRPRVLIVGEYLLNFHPGANHDIEMYLENNGFEVVEARMSDVIRKTYFYKESQIREYHVETPLGNRAFIHAANAAFNAAQTLTDRIAGTHPLYRKPCRLQDLAKISDPVIHHTFDAGEGILIPGEILQCAVEGIRNFIILQPFGCLPNHVVGRGVIKKIREMYPDACILPLDYDPDVSTANIENRLQMLIMNMKLREVRDPQPLVPAL